MRSLNRPAAFVFSLVALSQATYGAQVAIWTFPTLSGLSNGSSVNATTETLAGTPTATIRNSTIYASGSTGVAYMDAAGVAQPANKAIGWSDFKKSGQSVDGQIDFAFNASSQSSLILRFDYKHDHDSDNSENELQWLVSTNGGSSWSAATRFTITDNNAWKSKSLTLPSSIDGQSNVVVRLEKYASDSNATEVNDSLILDNVELTSGSSGGGGGQGPVITVASSSFSVPATNPVTLCGAVGDSADAARTAISLSPADADTPDANLTATASSSAPSVATASLAKQTTGDQDTYALTLNPLSTGYANITVTITDPQGHFASYTVNYAVSATSSTPATSRYHAGASDASSAIALDADWILVANDEDQIVRLYDRNHSGQPAKTFDLNTNLGLAKEADFEATVRFGNRIYLIGSHGNDKEGKAEPTRNISCSYDVSGTGTATTLSFVGKFTNLKSNLIAWDNANGHGLGSAALGFSASAATGVLPTEPEGFNIEAATQRGSQVLLGFRAPLMNKSARNKALVIPVTNFQSVVDAGSGTMQFGTPVLMDLGGRAIRSMATTPTGKILILAGQVGDSSSLSTPFQFYSWNGNATSAPVAIPSSLANSAANGGGSPEAIVDPPGELVAGVAIQVIEDNGTTEFYNDGVAGKDLATRAFAKSRSDIITLTSLPDEVAPVLTLPANLTREATGSQGAAVSFSVSALDVVDGAMTATATPASGSVFPIGTTTVNVSASDHAGNTANGSFTVTVRDTTAPTLNLPVTIAVEATASVGASVTFTATASDLVDATPSVVPSTSSGTVFPLGTTTVQVTATDDAGNTATGSFNVTVRDTTAPTLNLPGTITVEATGPGGARVTYAATASDLVDADPSFVPDSSSGTVFPLGTTIVQVTATDDAGNTASGSFNVIVRDTTAAILDTPSAAGAVVTFAVSGNDLVDGLVVPTAQPASGSVFPLGESTVTLSATDAAGNPATGAFKVTVVDSTAPSLNVPGDITLAATSNAGAIVNYTVSANDLVDGAVTPLASHTSGSMFAPGTTLVEITATDAAGNTATGSFSVTITTSPRIEITGESPLEDSNASLAFGSPVVGSKGTPRLLTIRNTGTADLLLGTLVSGGENPGDFEVTQPGITTLEPGGTTTFGLAFSPLESGPRAASVQVPSNDPDVSIAVFDIALAGTGIEPEPLAYAQAIPVIVPPAAGNPGTFSALVQGKPNAVVYLEASMDLGKSDSWTVIAQITLDNEGHGQFAGVVDGTLPPEAKGDFFRLRSE